MSNKAFKALARAVIYQSLKDLKRQPHKRTRREQAKEIEQNKVDARKWFDERNEVPFGYGWCLGVTGLRPNLIRKEIERIDKL